jgi:hypothetical protein
MSTLIEIDPNSSHPFLSSSLLTGIESVRENYTAKILKISYLVRTQLI